MTQFNYIAINGVDRTADVLRAESWHNVSSVGAWQLIMRNTGGKYNNIIDVNQPFVLNVNGPTTLMSGRVDGNAVTLYGKDTESIWDEYVVVRGLDNSQTLLFLNDFEKEYPETFPSRQIHTVLGDMFDSSSGLGDGSINATSINTPIWYDEPLATDPVGAFEFKEGGGFLGQLQELMRRAGYIFIVDHATFELKCGDPNFSAALAPCTFRSIAGDITNNIIGDVEFVERDGDKHYNYIKIYGKNPMFDGYTEYNALNWHVSAAAVGVLDDSTTRRVGGWSLVAYNNPAAFGYIGMHLDVPVYNYAIWDFTKGEIAMWARYDNIAGAPGAPGGGSADPNEYVVCTLYDNSGNSAFYYGDSGYILKDHWQWITFPLGEGGYGWFGTINNWDMLVGTELDWEHIIKMEFVLGNVIGRYASHFYIDGLSIPLPVLAIQQNVPSQTVYHRRPLIDSYPYIRSQNAMNTIATQLLLQSQYTSIRNIKFMIPGQDNLRYAGQTINLHIPSMRVHSQFSASDPDIYYITSLHHVVEPYVDVSKGYGFDWITEIEALPIDPDPAVIGSGSSYDRSRLRVGSFSTPAQSVGRLGGGARTK